MAHAKPGREDFAVRNAFIFLFFVLAVWTAIEVMNKGMGGAFDGAFVRVGLAEPEEGPEDTPMGRAAARVDDAYDRAERRVDDQLGE
jgi:hypothetical protein